MRKFKVHSLSGYTKKLFLGNLLALILAVAIMAVFNYSLTKDQQNKHMLELVSFSGEQTAAILETRFKQMESTSETVRYRLQMMLLQSTEKSPQPQYEANTAGALENLRDSFGYLDIS